MNLSFNDIHPVERDGVTCMLQRADVTRYGEFWRFWRSAAAEPLKKFIYVKPVDGKWFVYRMQSKDSDEIVYKAFNLTYQVRCTDKLYPYQIKPVAHQVQAIINHGAAADGSDTGIGKTYHALAVCRELSLKPFVICRKGGMYGWKRACAYLDMEPYVIVNWEMARTARVTKNGRPVVYRERRKVHLVDREYEINRYDYKWNLPSGCLLIFDEAHLGFSEESQNYAFWTASTGAASLSMSATFADRPDRLKALFSVLRIMEPYEFDKWLMDRGNFINQYNKIESLTALDDMKRINKVLYPEHGYRVSYDDPEVKKFFPERVIRTEVVDMGEKMTIEHNKAYDEMIAKAMKFREMGKQAELLVADLRYRQHAELLKVKVLSEMVRQYLYEGLAVCVFVNFRDTLRYLAELVGTKSLIFGAQEQYGLSREAVINAFQTGRERVILCMVDAGGQSIDLHDVHGKARRMSLICPTYNPVSLQQVLGRTHRAGSRSIPVMKLVYAGGTIEEKVAETVNRKLDSIAALNDGDLMEPDLFRLGVHHAA